MTKANTKYKFFAAANSYNGFISYFDTVFDPKLFDKLIILKGGPGTGKNSFMKAVRDHFSRNDFDIEEIYCSSDPSSLDGIIIKEAQKRVAIIDGTAPHERDSKYPGAIDEIVNLGQNWDSRWLTGQRTKILELNEEKRKAYSTAYEYLKLGRGAFEFIKSTHKKHFNYQEAEKAAKKVLKDTKKTNTSGFTIRLISAFGKNGYITLDTLNVISDVNIKVGGDLIYAMLFLDKIISIAKQKGISLQASPYPLSDDLTEAVFFPESRLAITLNPEKFTIDASSFSKGSSDLEKERIKTAFTILDDAKREAIRWFKIASDMHFRLEDIYSSAMNFEENTKMLKKTIEEFEIIFDKNK